MAVWVEELTEDSFKICLREVKIFDGLHKGIAIVSLKFYIAFQRSFKISIQLFFLQWAAQRRLFALKFIIITRKMVEVIIDL